MADYSEDFNDTTVLVTGGTSGIGREIAIRFGEAGANVVVADINVDPKDGDSPTHEYIERRSGEATFVETDVSSVDDVYAAVETAREYDGVDVMVNNAGVFTGGDFLEVTPDEFDRVVSVNMRGTFFGCQAAAKDMVERGVEGTIVNIASISSWHAQREQVQYDATKGAVKMITRGAALDLADHGIRVNGVAPGQIATEIIDGWSDDAPVAAKEGEFIKPVPLGRAGYPNDVAGTVLFLASDEAEYITGEIIMVDGGWQII